MEPVSELIICASSLDSKVFARDARAKIRIGEGYFTSAMRSFRAFIFCEIVFVLICSQRIY